MESMSSQSSLTLSPAASVTTSVDLESDHPKQRIKKEKSSQASYQIRNRKAH